MTHTTQGGLPMSVPVRAACMRQRGLVPSTRGSRAVYSARYAPFTLVYAPCTLRVRSVYAPCTLLFTSGFVLFTSGFVRFTSGLPAVYIRVTCGLHQGYLQFTPGLPAWAARACGPSRLPQGILVRTSRSLSFICGLRRFTTPRSSVFVPVLPWVWHPTNPRVVQSR